MENNSVTISVFDSLKLLSDIIIKSANQFDNLNEPLDKVEYSQSIAEIDNMIKQLNGIKGELENNQYDFSIDSYGSVEVEVSYEFSFNRADDDYVYYDYSTNDDYSSYVQLSKESVINCLENEEDLEQLICDEIEDEIRYRN